MKTIQIKNRIIGSGRPVFIIAEIAQAHGGSLVKAHAFIDHIADAGVDAVKFQTHIASTESTLDEPFRVKQVGLDKTRYDYWKRMEFSEAEWQELAMHAREKGLIFLSSPFSVEAVRLLQRIGVPAWKVGSGEFKSLDVIAAMAESHLPIIVSTGMIGFDEIDQCVKNIKKHDVSFALMQCTSIYPTTLKDVGLNVIEELRKRYCCPVGLSDHSGSVHPGLAAIYRGADLLEVHVKLDGDSKQIDASSSLLPRDLKLLAEARDAFEVMKNCLVNKDAVASSLSTVRSIFTKSIALVQDFPVGTVLERWMLTTKKPGTGIPPDSIDKLVGRKLSQNVSSSHLLKEDDIER